MTIFGFAGRKFAYDERGNKISESFFGADDMPCLIVDGNAGWRAVYDQRGNRTSWTFFGIDGKPCLIKAGYAGWKSTFDARGNETTNMTSTPMASPALTATTLPDGRPPTTTEETW